MSDDENIIVKCSIHEGCNVIMGNHIAEPGSRIHQIVCSQYEAFMRKFGRAPAYDDPIFFDPDADFPCKLTPEKELKHKALQEFILVTKSAARSRLH